MTGLAASQGSSPVDPMAAGRAAMQSGEFALAAARFQGVALSKPADFESRYWLYSALHAGGQAELARRTLDEARNIHAVAFMRGAGVDMARFGNDRTYCAEIGRRFHGQYSAAASLCIGRAIDFDSPDVYLMCDYALALQHQGRMQEAVDMFRAALELFPTSNLHQLLLYPLFHVENRMAEVSAEARRWAERYAKVDDPLPAAFPNNRSANRRLRIGYVAPSFTNNQVAPTTSAMFETHDPQAVQVFLYCNNRDIERAIPDGCRIKSIGGLSDREAAQMIRQDRIDILVDVWGHSAYNRLRVFAYRPAPVQISCINFMQTTGLECMDYVMHADSMDVPGTEAYFTEEIWRTGEIMGPYRPSPHRLPPTPTPALANGYITFGSFNHPAKLSDATVAAWGAILRARPSDRLVLKYRYFTDPVLQRVTQARFAAHGVDPAQIEFRGHTTGTDYTREFQDIDLCLDPSPCPGGTTTCDALSNGVPVLVLKGEDFYSRTPLPLLLPCGLQELVAESWDHYVARALELTADYSVLNELRSRVRPGFDASPYCDEAAFTRQLEANYRRMFARWLEASA